MEFLEILYYLLLNLWKFLELMEVGLIFLLFNINDK